MVVENEKIGSLLENWMSVYFFLNICLVILFWWFEICYGGCYLCKDNGKC